ncbi:HAMP domain-containing histidine kinase [Acetobacteraceae bacterium]|nr:HAMP domain-containing histidine kinase [Candidatus Parcubacteria bacterium]
MERYLRLFVGWVTASREKYTSDLFFRTTVHVVVLQAVLVCICIVTFWWTLQYTNDRILAAVVSNIQEIVTNASTADPKELARSISAIQDRAVILAFGSVLVLSLLFGILLARFTLRPARETLRYQKIFISNVAHELRTPLSTIKTSSEVALLDNNLAYPMRKTFGEILIELDRISQIINNLLSLNTLTRPERMQFKDVDLGDIVEDVVQRLQTFATERDIKIIVKTDARRTVWGNPSALEQIVNNLIKNALSYTPKSAEGVVTVSVRPDYNGLIVLSVADNGIGISQEDLFHIFEPFYRADTSRVRKIKKTGSGLGLTIVNEIVRVHHGRINIQSALHKGTTVSVTLPSGMQEGKTEGGQPSRGQSEVMLDFSKGQKHTMQN